MEKSRTQFKPAVEFVSEFDILYFHTITNNLGSLIEDGFLKNLFDNKTSSKTEDKAQLLIQRFGEAANPANFTAQAQASNIQPTTLSLLWSVALYASSKAWYDFQSQYYRHFGDMGPVDSDDDDESQYDGLDSDEDNKMSRPQTPYSVDDKSPILPDIVMIPVNQPVIPKNSLLGVLIR